MESMFTALQRWHLLDYQPDATIVVATVCNQKDFPRELIQIILSYFSVCSICGTYIFDVLARIAPCGGHPTCSTKCFRDHIRMHRLCRSLSISHAGADSDNEQDLPDQLFQKFA
jgi:hypothetical protein